MNKKVLVVIIVVIVWSMLFCSIWLIQSKQTNNLIVPKILELELLKTKTGEIKKISRNMFLQPKKEKNNHISIVYNVIATDNKKHNIKFFINIKEGRISSFVIGDEVYYNEK